MPMMATIRIATMTIHIRFLPPGARGAGVTGSAKVPPPSEPDAIRGARLRRKNSKTLFNRFRRRSIEGAPFTKPLHGALGPDSLDAFVEVGPDQDGDVDQLFPCQPKMREILLEIEDLGRNGARTALARQEFGRANRQEADHA